jgi:two-component system LytT family response regulator
MNNTRTCIIVEDEAIHSNRLRKLLAAAGNKIKIMAVCSTVSDAITKINELQPQLLFLDIQLQGNNRGGVDLLQQIAQPTFDVIFTTAYIDGNIEAIRRCGIDYLPKPYMQDELEDALRKVWAKHTGSVGIGQLHTLLHNLLTESLDEQFVWFTLTNGSFPVKIKNLIYGKASNQYTVMYVLDENTGKITEIMTSKGIGAWNKDLAALKFCRIHDNCLINTRHITKVDMKENMLYLKHIKGPLSMSATGKERINTIIKKPVFAI